MKRKDWHYVYQHYVNSGNRHTAIYFNGVRIPWEKAWKEIRRSGGRESIDCHATELPVRVVMRSPSPVPRSVTSLYEIPVPWDLSGISLETLSPAAVDYRSKLYQIPSNLLRIEMLNNSGQSLMGILTKSSESSLLHQSSTLSHRGSKDIDLSSRIARLSSALYRLADGSTTVDSKESFKELVDVIFNLTPKQALLKILAGDSLTIRAALRTLLIRVGRLGWKDNFVDLVKTTWRLHPDWTLPIICLEYAAEFGCVDSCRTLLQMIRWPKDDPSDHYSNQTDTYSAIILESVARGRIDCAKILFQHLIGPHTTLLQPKDIVANAIFYNFLEGVAMGRRVGNLRIPIGLENPAVLPMLDWLFEIGANVDLPLSDLHYTKYTPKNWMPTILDHIYFLNSKLYALLIDHSVKFRAEPTRPGIHHAASEGIDSLRMYLLSRSSHTPTKQDMLVDILLVEEFLRPGDSDFEVIRTLLDYSLGFRKLDLNASAMLYHVIGKARKQGMHPAVHHIANTLTQSGATIVAETMERAVESQGTTLLQLLFSYGADFKSQGALALCMAARISNYDAVNWLLDKGINTDGTLGDGWTILASASMNMSSGSVRIFDHQWVEPDYQCQPMGCEMLEYLISRKFKLRAKHGDTSARRLLCLILLWGPRACDLAGIRKKVQLIFDAEPWVNKEPRVDQCPLEASLCHVSYGLSEGLLLMNFLLECGVSARNSGVLAYLFKGNAPAIEIQKLLDSGADIDTYCGGYREDTDGYLYGWQHTPLQAAAGIGSLDWARYLIQKGADMNKPAKGCGGRTALQAACDTDPSRRNIDLIKFLIAAGADVNAPPAPQDGKTAFQGAANSGDLEVALLLLDNGANINALPAEKYGLCALDGAVRSSRLDMVQFLLDLGALSHDRSESGYRGAIGIAEERGNQIIADLIRRHALKNGKSGEELSADWDWNYTPSERSSEADDAEIWNQISWEDWLPL
ncbi:hypothetical protein F4823DRAFT_426345 [Ustulina deusta]|nr:hypothetical protein F4823DRAFT_426345 [Ustulina deusta]